MKQTKDSGYKWWKLRQKLVRFLYKSALILLAASALAWLNGEVGISLQLFAVVKYLIIGVALIIISQSFEFHETFIESYFDNEN